MNVSLLRLERVTTPGRPTNGILFINGAPKFLTLEPPWLNNRVNVSCIPTGKYLCKKYSSAKYPDTYEIEGVKGRDQILFHAGNFLKDTHGCVLLGLSFYWGDDSGTIRESLMAMQAFRMLTKGVEAFPLTISYAGGV